MTNDELKKAIEKYQEKHPLHFGAMIDVTAISSKEDANIVSQTIERISKEVSKDTDLWCICEMAKLYMQGVKPVYPIRSHGRWLPINYKGEAIEDVLETVWDEVYAPRFKCSECGSDEFASTYCPTCGALMEDSEENENEEV